MFSDVTGIIFIEIYTRINCVLLFLNLTSNGRLGTMMRSVSGSPTDDLRSKCIFLLGTYVTVSLLLNVQFVFSSSSLQDKLLIIRMETYMNV